MIATVLDIAVRRLRHGRTELMLTFLVPVVFFSIFALIFGSGIGRNPRVRTLLADADESELSAALVEAVGGQAGVVATTLEPGADATAEAERQVREGLVSAAVVVPTGWGGAVIGQEEPPAVRVLSDSSNQVGAQVVGALVQKAVFETVPKGPPGVGTPGVPPGGDAGAVAGGPPAALPESSRPTAFAPPPPVEVVDLLGEGKDNPLVAMSAAGIAVMFLLFSSAGSGGSLLEEEESGTLERLLSSRLTMGQLLAGKWLFITLQGVAQVTLMFAFGQLVFGVDLLGHLPGFAVMTLATAAAAASFALLLATACQSRTQLNGVSTILILTMSALGGSMVPRYVMSERMQEWGLVTFNAWALDGYNKVFWRDQPVEALGPQVAVLAAAAVGLMLAARVMARRWERA